MAIIIETERLILRPLRADDLDALTAALNNFNVSRYTARIPFPYERKDGEAFLAITRKRSPGTLHLAITRKDNGDRVCGGISYEKEERVELGYWLAEAEWGQGYGGEAARAMTDHAFRSGHDELAAGYARGNDASRRILEVLGFTAVGERTMFSKSMGVNVPVVRMKLSRADWERAAAH